MLNNSYCTNQFPGISLRNTCYYVNKYTHQRKGTIITMNLHEATEQLTQARDVCAVLKVVDKYTDVYRTNKRLFSLPDELAYLDPIVRYYANRSRGFCNYVLQIRDTFGKGSNQYADINKFYRTILARAIQQERRARADHAVEMAEKLHGQPESFSQRLSWIARREAAWAARRLNKLKEVRTNSGVKRLSREESNEVLEEFWKSIDEEINKGVPPWDK